MASTATTALPFSIAYRSDAKGPKLRQSEFATVAEAAAYATRTGIPLAYLSITEWDNDNTDGYGLADIVGSCCLDEAYELGYTSLS